VWLRPRPTVYADQGRFTPTDPTTRRGSPYDHGFRADDRPLTADEIAAASTILKEARGLGPSSRFVFVTLHEPDKTLVTSWQPGDDPLPREAHIVLYQRGARTTCEAVVSLTAREVLSFREVPGVQAPIMTEEFESCEGIVVADPRWQEAMRRRGVEDFSLAMVDPWASSWTGPEDDPSARRIARPLTWMRSAPGEHGYARPVEGLVVLVDLDAGEVIDVQDTGVVPFPPKPGNYEEPWIFDPDNVPAVAAYRDDVKPIAGPRVGTFDRASRHL
jgi:primary-amine oxidase